MKYKLLLLSVFLIMAAGVSAQPVRITEPITPDGRLDEPAWALAYPVTDFTQISPVDGGSPAFPTDIRLLYDDDYLYIGGRMTDPEPGQIIARIMERDGLTRKDDYLVIAIDSHLDGINGVVFHTTPTGVRDDYSFTADGETGFDSNWNTFWDVGCQVDSLGWTAEFRIPWRSLRFESAETVTMAMVFSRMIQRKKEISISPAISSKEFPNARFKISKGHRFSFTGLEAKNPYYLTFYQSGSYNYLSELNSGKTGYSSRETWFRRYHYSSNPDLDRFLSSSGLDVKMGLSKSFTLDLTVNPDFSQVEVDDEQLNLTRFRLVYPEKRDFFNENAQLFTVNIGSARIFYSRRIGLESGQPVPITGGLRLTGRAGDHQMGLLYMRTATIDESRPTDSHFAVFRDKYSLFNNGSYAGGLVTFRSDDFTSNRNLVVSQDAEIRFNTFYRWAFRGAVSDDSKQEDQGTAWETSIGSVKGDGFRPFIKYTRVDDLFHPGTGFTVRDGYQAVYGYLSNISFYDDQSSLRKTDYRVEGGVTWKDEGDPEVVFAEFSTETEWKSGALIYPWLRIDEEILRVDDVFSLGSHAITEGTYQQIRGGVYAENENGSLIKFSTDNTLGWYYDGFFLEMGGEVELYANEFWAFRLSGTLQEIKWETDSYSADLAGFRIKWTPTTTILSNLFVQFNTLSKKLTGYYRLRWQPSEGNNLYFVITQTSNTDLDRTRPALPAVENMGVALKYTLTTGF